MTVPVTRCQQLAQYAAPLRPRIPSHPSMQGQPNDVRKELLQAVSPRPGRLDSTIIPLVTETAARTHTLSELATPPRQTHHPSRTSRTVSETLRQCQLHQLTQTQPVSLTQPQLPQLAVPCSQIHPKLS
ncbi:uncharacterized protein LY79DRAFT_62696 [Colletotrichum navitas]|uniref:Uncharacterized protein n=1 Tax=Colletotrichum navitas TaxID=681940 RepID=A0AAD8Q5U4_9PEZI|nr:uncharacterized protein LY79DRAFT_62696 [Colletotrichum navitas]KAK1596377.1 hypothetical protein LY79DRAFT_62696 [Colletotrichum navitas]